MELKELENLWEDDTSRQPARTMNEQQMSHFMQQQSATLLGRIERALRNKTWRAAVIGLFVCSVAPVYVLEEGDFLLDQLLSPVEMSIMLMLMGLIVLHVAYQSWQSRKQLLGFQQTSTDVKTTLGKASTLLNRLQRLKINSDAVGVPFFSAWLAYSYFFKHTDLGWFTKGALLVVVVVLIIWLSQYAARWANSYYQDYIDQLTAYQQQLEEA